MHCFVEWGQELNGKEMSVVLQDLYQPTGQKRMSSLSLAMMTYVVRSERQMGFWFWVQADCNFCMGRCAASLDCPFEAIQQDLEFSGH
jgi:hypothetical protein